jgi:hypothetical protein
VKTNDNFASRLKWVRRKEYLFVVLLMAATLVYMLGAICLIALIDPKTLSPGGLLVIVVFLLLGFAAIFPLFVWISKRFLRRNAPSCPACGEQLPRYAEMDYMLKTSTCPLCGKQVLDIQR